MTWICQYCILHASLSSNWHVTSLPGATCVFYVVLVGRVNEGLLLKLSTDDEREDIFYSIHHVKSLIDSPLAVAVLAARGCHYPQLSFFSSSVSYLCFLDLVAEHLHRSWLAIS